MGDSPKFKLLKELYEGDEFRQVIPPIFKGKIDDDFFDNEKMKFILRSALKGEAKEEKLLSGVSLSVPNIGNKFEFTEALELIRSQGEVEEILFQLQYPHQVHGTLLATKELWYVELKESSQSTKIWIGPQLTLGEHPVLPLILDFKKKIEKHFKEINFLMEMGFKTKPNLHYKLYQIQPVSPEKMKHVFNSDSIFLTLRESREATHTKKEREGLLSLLWKEWKAFRFRSSFHKLPEFEAAFKNWNFIFHYFKLFCVKQGLQGGDLDYVEFLKASYGGKGHFNQLSKKHLIVANEIRAKENLKGMGHSSAQFSDQDQGYYFLGQKDYLGPFDSKVYVTNEIVVERLSQRKEVEVILTSSKQLLSHGFLYALEQGISIVANIPMNTLKSFQGKDRLAIDFENKKIGVK